MSEQLDKDETLVAQFKEVYETPSGRAVINHILKLSGILCPPVNYKKSVDYNAILVKEGARIVGQTVLHMLDGTYQMLIDENRKQISYMKENGGDASAVEAKRRIAQFIDMEEKENMLL